MRNVEPDFYRRFRCRAGRCGHSCCRGWEIGIDAGTAEYYQLLPGPLGEELRAAVRREEDGAAFRLTEDMRCPFLQEDGLCRLILSLGEDALCEICALHPRFFEEIGGFALRGLGLSCEAACALLLEDDHPLRFLVEGGESTELPGLLRLLGMPVAEDRLRFRPRLTRARCREILRRMADTEPIDDTWPREVEALGRALPAKAENWDRPRYDRLFQYIVYRQLDAVQDVGMNAVLAYARLSAEFILLWDLISPGMEEHARRWSEQIEYSTENVERLLREP